MINGSDQFTSDKEPPRNNEKQRILAIVPTDVVNISSRKLIRVSLKNFAVIASFGRPLEPLQRILYPSLDHLAAKGFEYPSPPTWRESEVSAILHEAGDGVKRGAGGRLVVGDTHSGQNPVDLMLLGVHGLDLERAVPPQRVFQIDYLAG